MPTNSQFAVATHILALLAVHNTSLTSKFISSSVNTNPVVVRRIIGALQNADLVATTMGADGGTILKRKPEEISLLMVYRATHQGRVLVLHSNEPSEDCIVGRNITETLSPVFDRAQITMERELAKTTIGDIRLTILRREGLVAEAGNA
ncbi:MAG: Rrf2 family transcriptional regulator [Phototrophicaceae bacterium]|jgi:DNA-binding IscR family transcriptional regulator